MSSNKSFQKLISTSKPSNPDVTFTFEGNDKFILASNCSHCSNQNTYTIPLEVIFKHIQRKNKSTKGPIDSIKALLNNQKPKLQ